jgi:hypothetical protein
MHGRFPHLSTFSKKFLEVCGAGLASTVVACLLGQTDKPAAPLSPVVYLSPADAQMLKLMHNDQAALLERLRSQPEAPAAPVAAVDVPAAPPAAAPIPLPPKSASAAPARRELKPDRALTTAAVKQRPEEPSPAVSASAGKLPPIAAVSSMVPPEASEPQASFLPAVVAEAADWVSSLRQIPGRFWPAGGGLLSAAPRPPVPVGNLIPHMM